MSRLAGLKRALNQIVVFDELKNNHTVISTLNTLFNEVAKRLNNIFRKSPSNQLFCYF